MAAIAANCMTAVTPEQAAIWSYPLKNGDEEETAFNMVNAILMRIHQSGHLANLSPARLAIVQEGIRVFNQISKETSRGLPIWPLGLATMQKNIICTGLDSGSSIYLAVWCTKEDAEANVSVRFAKAECIFPTLLPTSFELNQARDSADTYELTVKMKARTARLYRLY